MKMRKADETKAKGEKRREIAGRKERRGDKRRKEERGVERRAQERQGGARMPKLSARTATATNGVEGRETMGQGTRPKGPRKPMASHVAVLGEHVSLPKRGVGPGSLRGKDHTLLRHRVVP